MFSPSDDSSVQTSDQLSQIFPSIFSDEGKIMLAAIISLLIVILFVLLLHLYGKWFLGQPPHRRRRRRRSASVSHVLGPARLYHLGTITTTFTYANDAYMGFPANGLDGSVIASLPLFVYDSKDFKDKSELECVICLSVFEDDEMGRSLPKCHHAFHVECIDMWLLSHSTCPICRAPVAVLENSTVVTALPVQASPPQEGRQEPLEVNGNSSSELSIEIPNVESSAFKESSSSSSLASPSGLLGSSLQRMLSKNTSERKVVYTSYGNVNEFNV